MLEQNTLSAAAFADNGRNLSFENTQIRTVEDFIVTESFMNIYQLNQRKFHFALN
jgi:hypothetical protein